MGYSIGQLVMREDGMPLYEVDGVLIFRSDVLHLVNATVTLGAIVRRNKGRVFPNAPTM
jgi:hypothetical protein